MLELFYTDRFYTCKSKIRQTLQKVDENYTLASILVKSILEQLVGI